MPGLRLADVRRIPKSYIWEHKRKRKREEVKTFYCTSKAIPGERGWRGKDENT